MDQIITFDKSLQQRLEEFKEILSGNEVLPASAIEKKWSFYLELTVDSIGWQAVWKIPRITCETLNIAFPSVVLVLVLDVDYNDLVALVRVMAVQDEISIPEKHYVPLIQLWPTKEQDKSIGINLESTAESLDMLRFFYIHVFMPWDREEDNNVDWKSKHLESRLRLYYDMINGVIPRVIAQHVHSLLNEARRLQNKRDYIESQLSEQDDVDYNNGNTSNKKVEILLEIHIRLLEIRSEIDIIENPLLRNTIIKSQSELISKDSDKQQIWIIFDQGRADSYIHFLEEVKKYYPSEFLKFSTNLASRLERSNSKDVFLLNESLHNIHTTGSLEKGGVLKGIGSRNHIVLTSDNEDVMLDFHGESIIIENITIDSKSSQCAILVRRGKTILKNCKLIGDGISSTHQGIIVLANAELNIIDSEITGFSTCIVGNSESKISLQNCEIHHVNIGVKVYDKCIINIQQSNFHDCHEYGIVVETEDNQRYGEGFVGSFDILSTIPEFYSNCVSGDNNFKGNVIIHKKNSLKPVEDLFANPDLDPTIIESLSEDMDVNETVIENQELTTP